MAAHDDSATVASPVGVPRTIRTDTIGKHILRLVAVGKTFAGLLISAGKHKARIDGEDPDAVWRELKALVGKSSDAYFPLLIYGNSVGILAQIGALRYPTSGICGPKQPISR